VTTNSMSVSLGGLDAELHAFLQKVSNLDASLIDSGLDDTQRRRHVSELIALALPSPPDMGVARRDTYIGAAGREIPVRLYLPPGGQATRRRLMVYFHGGGWMVGSVATHDALCAQLALELGYVVASVHYRRAPENPFPAPLDDGWEAVRWLSKHGGLFGADPQTPLALGGDSAGAHLALGCAMQASDQGDPAIDRLLLFYPPVHRHADTPSLREFDRGPGLSTATMRHFWDAYIGDPHKHADDPRLHLDLWTRPASLPPAVIMTAACDILRDEGEAYAHRLAEGGLKVVLLRAAAMPHGFARMLTASAQARAHVRQACVELLALV